MEHKQLNYILGLDLGIASVGWAVVEVDADENPINLIDVGVRTFERAEVPKTGESLALARRLARSARRLTKRRANRMKKVRRLLKAENILLSNDERLPNLAWELRVEGLDRKLERQEWAAVLLHLIKHRGYLSQRKNEEQTDNKELGALLSGVASNHMLLAGEEYRTPAEIAVKKFAVEEGHMRNQLGAYTHTFGRKDLLAEMELLFNCQQQFGNPFASHELFKNLSEVLMWQKPALSGEAILKMLGKCTFEQEEYKAPKNSYSAERFVWLTKLNNLRIQEDGSERALSAEERAMLIDQPYVKAKLTYKQVREILGLGDNGIFKGVRYAGEDKLGVEGKTTLMEMKAYHQIRKTLDKASLKNEWESIKNNAQLLDEIGNAFSLYKTDEDISKYLGEKVSPTVLNALLSLSFDKFIQLSLKALYKILPLMEEGLRYDEACTQVYGDHYGHKKKEDHRLLPKISADEIRNPVVLRTLTQARKVINGVVRLYGSPARIHIETGREVGKSYKDRRNIERQQEENRKQREQAVAKFKEYFPNFAGEPKPKDILKMRLYEQQHCKCLYSGHTIDINRLNEKGYVEVDHALPFSRTWDDSFNNKVLVLASENQNKGNQTPFEWLDGKNNSQAWQEFKARVETSKFAYGKKQKILTQKLDEEGFIERNLNDTRYVARFLCNFIADKMHLSGNGKRKVFASNGQITALLRGRWGLTKVRDDNDRHHALDAVVVACSTRAMQNRITKFMRYEAGKFHKDSNNLLHLERVDQETGEIIPLHFPEPWKFFRQEVNIRIFSDNPQLELDEKLKDRPQANHEFVQPLFVSRMSNRKVTGQGHMETIKSAKRLEEGLSVLKVPLTQLSLEKLEKMVNREREPQLYAGLKARLEAFNNDPAKAFAEPFVKKGGAVVKSVRIEDTQKSGVLVRQGNGVADNASMVRVDVFIKGGKYFLVPIYTWQVAKGILPNRAVIKGKDEDRWELMDESASFQFSLYPNDLIKLVTKKKTIFGYFGALDRSNGSINIKEHDLDKKKCKDGIHRVGVKLAQSLEKHSVDELGKNIRRCKRSKRQPVALFKRNKIHQA